MNLNRVFITGVVLSIASFLVFYIFNSSGYLNSMTTAYGMVWSLVFLIVFLSLLILKNPIKLEKLRMPKLKR